MRSRRFFIGTHAPGLVYQSINIFTQVTCYISHVKRLSWPCCNTKQSNAVPFSIRDWLIMIVLMWLAGVDPPPKCDGSEQPRCHFPGQAVDWLIDIYISLCILVSRYPKQWISMSRSYCIDGLDGVLLAVNLNSCDKIASCIKNFTSPVPIFLRALYSSFHLITMSGLAQNDATALVIAGEIRESLSNRTQCGFERRLAWVSQRLDQVIWMLFK
jgi:hypothetical protein